MSSLDTKHRYHSIKIFHVIHLSELPPDIRDLGYYGDLVDGLENDAHNEMCIANIANDKLRQFFIDLLPEDTECFLLDVRDF